MTAGVIVTSATTIGLKMLRRQRSGDVNSAGRGSRSDAAEYVGGGLKSVPKGITDSRR